MCYQSRRIILYHGTKRLLLNYGKDLKIVVFDNDTISDGDAKTYQYLNTKEVYGPEIKIKKEECMNHVSKRLGTSLRKSVKEWRARGVSLSGNPVVV
ncbi:hypothetical protein TNCV_2963081 [Trichonephila clavipes]|nr:hypothetical protein TNCV_2963081 [Trichonephila clavipes]